MLRGYPGTGKIQALLDIAVAHAEAGRQVLFTCYNKVLATALRASLAVREVPEATRERLLIKDVYEIKSGLTDEDLTVYAGTFGTVCVDEAQDMWGSLIQFVQRLARPDAEWFLADGTGQELYDEPKEQFSPASELLLTAREHGIKQRLNRQFRTSSAAALFAQAAFETALDQSKVTAWVAGRPLPRREESLDWGVGQAGDLPTFTTISESNGRELAAAYSSEIESELKLLEAIGACHDLMIMIPRRNDEHDLVRQALDRLGMPLPGSGHKGQPAHRAARRTRSTGHGALSPRSRGDEDVGLRRTQLRLRRLQTQATRTGQLQRWLHRSDKSPPRHADRLGRRQAALSVPRFHRQAASGIRRRTTVVIPTII